MGEVTGLERDTGTPGRMQKKIAGPEAAEQAGVSQAGVTRLRTWQCFSTAVP